jgi:hypothetical protein
VKATQMMRQFSDVAAERGLPMEELWKWSNKEGFSCLTEYFSFFCCICWGRFQLYLSIGTTLLQVFLL